MIRLGDARSWAMFSDDQRHRHELVRVWDAAAAIVTWCMCNPSTATHDVTDATIRKCIGFAKRWGFGGIRVVNLLDWRETDPKHLKKRENLASSVNGWLLDALSPPVVVGWGGSVPRTYEANRMATRVRHAALRHADRFWCLGLTKRGEPRHPLMLSYSTERQRWPA